MDFYESGSNESKLNEIYCAHMLHGAGIFTKPEQNRPVL